MLASSPPVPARISSITSLSSRGSLGSSSTLSSASMPSMLASSSFTSSLAISRMSASSPASLNISLAPSSSSFAVFHWLYTSTTGSSDARCLVMRSISLVSFASSGSPSIVVSSSNWFETSCSRFTMLSSAILTAVLRACLPMAGTAARRLGCKDRAATGRDTKEVVAAPWSEKADAHSRSAAPASAVTAIMRPSFRLPPNIFLTYAAAKNAAREEFGRPLV
mmetsp:Transcript_56585/g.136835  ORF Transcript_56585/g.136835 Transcript_56585/m.136835 type:complete len:222 (-) Transcript_56585:15-680(-)